VRQGRPTQVDCNHLRPFLRFDIRQRLHRADEARIVERHIQSGRAVQCLTNPYFAQHIRRAEATDASARLDCMIAARGQRLVNGGSDGYICSLPGSLILIDTITPNGDDRRVAWDNAPVQGNFAANRSNPGHGGSDAYSGLGDLDDLRDLNGATGAGPDVWRGFSGLPEVGPFLRLQLHDAGSVQRVGIGPHGTVLHQSIFCERAAARRLLAVSPRLLIAHAPQTDRATARDRAPLSAT